MSGERGLQPARYGDSGGPEGFRSAFPWRVLLGVALVGALVISLHLYLTHKKVEGLRAEMMALIAAEIDPVRTELEGLRSNISSLVLERYRGVFQAPYVAEGFDLETLRGGPVLTLRLGRRGPLEGEEVALVVKHGTPDDIGSCLGVPNQPASALYLGGDFLSDDYVQQVRVASSELELRGMRDQLERRILDVLPKLRAASKSGHMILSIDRPGEGLIEVSVIDLAARRDLLRILAKAEGTFLSAKIDLGGVRPPRGGGDEAEVRGAIDCGVAIQIKALLDRAAAQAEPTADTASP
jgi:hypothetical protein